MMDTNIFGKLEPFEIGCVVKYSRFKEPIFTVQMS